MVALFEDTTPVVLIIFEENLFSPFSLTAKAESDEAKKTVVAKMMELVNLMVIVRLLIV